MRLSTLLSGTFLGAAAAFAGAASLTPSPMVLPPTTAPSGAVAGTVISTPSLSPEQTAFFESKIRPIFIQSCYKCHSIEQGKAKGGLVLDSREGWQKGGDDGVVILPGNPTNSPLIKAINYGDPDLQMPPKGEKLTDAQIADLTAWVKMGAPDPRTTGPVAAKLTGLNDKARAHWAYQPVKDPAVPQPKDKAWGRTPVDAFILSKLDENGMVPAHPAPRETLIRRATYDLIGLPPTPQEVKAFVNDHSPNAFEKVVDRLLASPHYGERWGRFWLDTCRYADTTGEDQVRKEDYRYAYAWTYRDWVIDSYNSDKPYDEFLKEQIAADQLPDAAKHPDNLAALGFLTVGKRFQNPNDTLDERIDAITKGTMALTVSCARCHDHKFDPIPQADYYSLHGILSSTIEPEDQPLVGATPTGPEYEDYLHKLAGLEQKDKDIYYNLIQTKSAEFRKKSAAYLMTAMYSRKSTGTDLLARNKLIAENNLEREVLQGMRGMRTQSELFLPLNMFAQLTPEQFPQQTPQLIERIARLGKAHTINSLVAGAFAALPPDSLHDLHDVANVYAKLFASVEPQARQFIEASRNATSMDITGFDADLVRLIDFPTKIEPAPYLTTQHLRDLLIGLPAVNNTGYNMFLFTAINELAMTHPGAPGRAMIVADSPFPHNDPIFIRGEALNRGAIAPRRFLEILSGPNREPFKIGSGRLELAQDIASRNNPLTARVLINRVWMHHFGEGFVPTPDDLGVQSEPPSHPELLDYLASRFMQDPSASGGQGMGWSIKKLHKLIMLSSVYQESSDTNAAYTQKDPENRLLWRANLRRLDFEAIRDSMLVFSGKLDETIGGKPVNLTDEPYSNRRSVYGYIDRGNVPELMSQFDFSDPDRANSRRTSTIVPQQALFFMNSPMSADVARKITSRPEFTQAKDDYAKVNAIYEVIYQRPPRGNEVRMAAEFYNEVVTSGNAHGATPRATARPDRPTKQYAGQGKYAGAKRPIENEGETVSRDPLDVWQQYVQALLFTNEVAYVN